MVDVDEEQEDSSVDIEDGATHSSNSLPTLRSKVAEAVVFARGRPRKEYYIVVVVAVNVTTFILAVVALSVASSSESSPQTPSSCGKHDVSTWGQEVHAFEGHSYQLVPTFKAGIYFPTAEEDAQSRCLRGHAGCVL